MRFYLNIAFNKEVAMFIYKMNPQTLRSSGVEFAIWTFDIRVYEYAFLRSFRTNGFTHKRYVSSKQINFTEKT